MNRRPPHEPSRQFQQPQRLWDDAAHHVMSLGCSTCLERHHCGGVHTDAGVLDCQDLCSCADKSKCDMVCRFNPSKYVARMREIKGLGFENAPRTTANGMPEVPLVVPFVDHRYGRTTILNEPVVAISLYELVNMATGKVHVSSRAELAERFLINADSQIVVSGVDKDKPIERWWELKGRLPILEALKNLGVTLITVPNYSVLTDLPRTDNLYAMKRILLAWTEMSAAGLASALHVNGRTEHDYVRWSELIRERPEIEILAFEFATGCGWGGRIDWHISQLCALADRVERPLVIIIRGGGRKLDILRRHFARVSLIETEAFTRTIRRRRAYLTEAGRLKWGKFETPIGAPLDDLFAHNVSLVRASYEAPRHRIAVSLSPPAKPRRTAHANDKAAEPSFLCELDLAGKARGITPQSQCMVTTTKP